MKTGFDSPRFAEQVRHPLDRLISAYQDRVLDPDTDVARQHGPSILQLQPPAGPGTTTPTFQQFIRYQSVVIARPRQPGCVLCRYVVGGGRDLHWDPATQLCSPCLTPAHLVLKLEDGEPGIAALITAVQILCSSQLSQRFVTLSSVLPL